mgnify:CR=1|tara:strand:- start:419 stop:871 length:453 start_codon:yes stop_codon:yes gene_type:complete
MPHYASEDSWGVGYPSRLKNSELPSAVMQRQRGELLPFIPHKFFPEITSLFEYRATSGFQTLSSKSFIMSEYHKLPPSETDQEIQNEQGSRRNGENRTNIVPWIWCTLCTITSILAVASTIVQRRQLSALLNGGRSKLRTDFGKSPNLEI